MKDEFGNIISDAEWDHIYRSNGEWYETKDEWGNIVKRDSRGNELSYDSKTNKEKIVSSK